MFLNVCSAFTITSHLLCSPPPAEDCQLLAQIPKVRCLRNGRREGECGATAGWGGDKLAFDAEFVIPVARVSQSQQNT